MGYDLRITRAEHWDRNEGREINMREWYAIIEADPDLHADFANGPCAVRFGEGGWFDWFEGNVFTTDRDLTAVSKMVAIAGALGASVQGDGGELYASSDDWLRSPNRLE